MPTNEFNLWIDHASKSIKQDSVFQVIHPNY